MDNKNINVVKRNGKTEPLNIDKIHLVCEMACEGIPNVSVSQIEMKSHIQFYDGIKSSDIQEILIKASADLISIEEPNYQYVAARLNIFNIRKKLMVPTKHHIYMNMLKN